jgi:DNA-binding NtrC family response regulator
MSKRKVLVVEDDFLLLQVYKGVLQSPELDIDLTDSIDQAKEMLRGNPYDIMITDMVIPPAEDGGFQLIEFCRDNKPEVKVFLITGFLDSQISSKAFEMGVRYCFKKPVSVPALRAAMLKQF